MEIENNKKPMNLTERDVKILSMINKAGLVDSAFIRTAFFKNGKSIAHRRLQKMESANLIERESISSNKTYYKLANAGARIIEAYIGEKRIKTNHRKSEDLHENLILQYAGHLLSEKITEESKIFFEKQIMSLDRDAEYYPDLLFQTKDNSRMILEVELTQKESSRFYDKLRSYERNKDIFHVFYIVSNGNLRTKIENFGESGKFTVVTVKNFLANPGEFVEKAKTSFKQDYWQ